MDELDVVPQQIPRLVGETASREPAEETPQSLPVRAGLDAAVPMELAGKDAPGYFNAWLLKAKNLRIDAFTFDTGWYDIGDRASYIEANRRYANADFWKGEDVVIENSTVTNSVLLDEVVIVDSSIEGCVVDCGAHIEGVRLRDCLIGKGTIVKRA